MSNTPTLETLKGSTVLITGAGGFIGGHLFRELKKIGANIIAVDRKPSTGIYGSNVADSNQLQRIFKLSSSTYGRSIEYIFHLAGQKSAMIARDTPADTLRTSFNGAINILEYARKIGTVKKVIFISSLAVYGVEEDNSSALIKESDPVQNDSIYSATKIGTEAIGLSYGRDFGLPVCIARLSNVYGPKQAPGVVIPSIISQMKSGQKTISMGNIDPVRDFIYVSDVVDALMLMGVNPATAGRVFNVSTGQGTSIKRILELLKQNLNYSGEIVSDPAKIRANEKINIVADNSELKKATGWSPKVKIEDGLKIVCQ